ncbi:MAG: FkbM family methyltransferase, partial [Candidatus Cloacimonetes bacterium]|nr:FkbM family methyltransferase [Candidatus Cloacimonadota bacterium]
WTGINLDAMPGSMKAFKKFRKKDVNLEIPISISNKTLTYYCFNEPALNTFSEHLAQDRQKSNNQYVIEKELELRTFKLSEVLDKYLPAEKKIDFLTIDVEGFDLEVLKSNDWSKYIPSFILIEVLKSNSYHDVISSDINVFLEQKGYVFFAKSLNTIFFKHLSYKR